MERTRHINNDQRSNSSALHNSINKRDSKKYKTFQKQFNKTKVKEELKLETAEVWKDIEGYEGKYLISNKGRVKSLCRNNEIILKTKLDHHQRLCVALRPKNTVKFRQVSTLVYKYFIDPEIDTHKNFIRYKDNNPMNCNVNNLYLMSRKQYYNQAEALDKRKKKDYIYKGKHYNITSLSIKTGISKRNIAGRLTNGWSIEEAVEIPLERHERILKKALYLYNGQLFSIKQMAEKYNISTKIIYKRLKRGWSIEETIEIPIAKYNKGVK